MSKVPPISATTLERRALFLAALREVPNVSYAAKKSGWSRRYAYEVRAVEPDFAVQWDDALAEGIEAMEEEAHRRAFKGYKGRPVVHQGEVVADVTEYSDTLTCLLLKAHAPDKYADRSHVDLTTGGKTMQLDDETRVARIAALFEMAIRSKVAHEAEEQGLL